MTTDDDALADRARKLQATGWRLGLDRHKADRVIIEESRLGFNYRMTDIRLRSVSCSSPAPQLLRIRIERPTVQRGAPTSRASRSARAAVRDARIRLLRLTKRLQARSDPANLLHRGIATRRGVMTSHLRRRRRSRRESSLPVTEGRRAHDAHPLFATMTDEEQTYVIDALREELGTA
jgi:dTDP-4-amino-4,6-dideoxygalactose transaminase